MNFPKNIFVASLLFGAAALSPLVAGAQTSDHLAARRQAILQQDELVTDDGQIVDPSVALVPATRASFRSSPDSSPFQEVRWRRGYYGGYYGRPYSVYYGPRYGRYPRYYDPYYGGYGYRAYGPGYGYYRYGDPYYYGRPYGAARVGPIRVFW